MDSFIAIENFKKGVLQLVNNSQLQVSTAYFILKSITKDLEILYNKFLNEEQTQILIQQYKKQDQDNSQQEKNINIIQD